MLGPPSARAFFALISDFDSHESNTKRAIKVIAFFYCFVGFFIRRETASISFHQHSDMELSSLSRLSFVIR